MTSSLLETTGALPSFTWAASTGSAAFTRGASMHRLQKPFASVLDLIGQTPVVELKKFDAGPCRLFAKLESQNPSGSIKDRIALSMIGAAEKDGRLKAVGTIGERTAGNTGLGLAHVCIMKSY